MLAIAALLLLAIRVSGLSDLSINNKGYRISAAFSNIGGLKVRSKVTIGGVNIGRVASIDLQYNADSEAYEPVVSMLIDHNIDKLPTDSQASILTAGLLGDNYVGIELGMDDNFLRDGDTIKITTQALSLEGLISKFALKG